MRIYMWNREAEFIEVVHKIAQEDKELYLRQLIWPEMWPKLWYREQRDSSDLTVMTLCWIKEFSERREIK